MAGKHHVVAGSFKNKAQVAAARVMPEPVKAKTDPALLTEEELRRQLAYLVQFKGDIAHRAALRLRQLNIEHRRRVAVSTF